jgi:hypothetical protein
METWARQRNFDVDGAFKAWLRVLRHVQFAEFASYGMPCVKCDNSGVWVRQGVGVYEQPCPVRARTTASAALQSVAPADRAALN